MVQGQMLSRYRIFILSLLIAIPCFWLPIVSGVDLQSHLYNAWLCNLIKNGQVEGLQLHPQLTNILIDVFACKLLPLVGVSGTERCITTALVLIMFWGMYWFVSQATNQKVQWIIPWVAVVCYGFVFQMGFCNFYLASGISFWVLSLMWKGHSLWRIFLSILLLGVAFLAHPIPVLWAVVVIAYVRIVPKLSMRLQALLCFVGIAFLVVLRGYITHRYSYFWNKDQIASVTGIDQIWLLGWNYVLVSALIFFLAAHSIYKSLNVRYLASPLSQIFLLTATAAFIMPNEFGWSADHAASGYITQRFSFFAAAILLALISYPRPKWYLGVSLVGASIFFVSLFHDVSHQSEMVQEIHQLVAPLPYGERVIYFDRVSFLDHARNYAGVKGLGNRLESILTQRLNTVHLLSRACIGSCFDYMNYEPSTGQFHVKAYTQNPVVTASLADSIHMSQGTYIVQPKDLPIYGIVRCPGERLIISAMNVGESLKDIPCK